MDCSPAGAALGAKVLWAAGRIGSGTVFILGVYCRGASL